MSSPPLLELFDRLRLTGLPLGIEEYQLVLKALQGGFGVQDRVALRRLCEKLWAKNEEEKRLLHQYFEELFPTEQEVPAPPPVPPPMPPRPIRINPWLIGGIACGISLIAVIGYVAIYPKVGFIPIRLPGFPSEKPTPGIPNLSPTPVNPSSPHPDPIQEVKQFPFWLRSLLVGGFAVSGGVLVWFLGQGWVKRKPTLLPDRLSDQVSEITTTLQDEIEAARAQERLTAQTTHRFWIATPGLPATERQMKRSWRYLSRPVREGTPTELDVQATIQQIGRQGWLLEPVLVPPRTNQVALLLLLDRDGSMEPFHALTERLVATAQRGGRFGMTQVYYFHNCPVDYLYRDRLCSEAEPIEAVFESLPLRHLSPLIISDAGAVRGRYNPYRVKKTQEFLRCLYQQVRYAAWLNPLPPTNWEGTTASAISKHIPMFGCDRAGLDGAIEVLRGRNRRVEVLG